MLPSRLRSWFPTLIRSPLVLWLGLSLLVSLLYSLPALQQAFSSPYVIQDDARQHVFWMRRFLDPELFPGDLTADYFQSVAPWGYTTLYQLLAGLGLDPVVLSKILPLILGWISTVFCFGVGYQILPIPAAGFATATLLNQNLWMRDDLSSATPGAFFYPIFLAFLYFLLRTALWPCLLTIALQGLFYPQCVFLSAGILLLRLLDWDRLVQGKRFSLSADRRQVQLCLAGIGVACGVIVLYGLKSSEFGRVITAAEAKTLPAFSPTGWSAFFTERFTDFWFCGKRSGLLPTEWCDLAKDKQEVTHWWLALRFPSLGLAALFPLLAQFLGRFPLVKQISHDWQVLLQGLVVSLGMFFLAHLLLFRLHLPNRYTEHSLRIFLALAAGLALTLLWDQFWRWCCRRFSDLPRSPLGLGIATLLTATLIFYPYSLEVDHASFPITGYVRGEAPALYRFFAKQPKDIVIASLTEEANQIPTFSQRALLVGGEGYLLPYHPQYFREASQRLLALLQAQYSPDLGQVQAVIQRYGIDFWLLDRFSFQPDFNDPKSYLNDLFQQFPTETTAIKAQIEAGTVPALSQLVQLCSALNRQGFVVLRSRCILKQ